jgi:hypothetical protein
MLMNKTYWDLIEKVAKIDIKAALYLRNEAINLPDFSYSYCLQECFPWAYSTQGYLYWDDICNRIKYE